MKAYEDLKKNVVKNPNYLDDFIIIAQIFNGELSDEDFQAIFDCLEGNKESSYLKL